jgi:hypothetical protein
MAKVWTDEEIRAMVNDSVRILHEDNQRRTYQALHEKYGAKPDDDNQDPGKTPPPAKEKKDEPDPPKRKPLWGNYADDADQ